MNLFKKLIFSLFLLLIASFIPYKALAVVLPGDGADPPAKPTNLSTARACNGTSSNISFNWSAVGNATSYVFRLNDYRGTLFKKVTQASPNYLLQGSTYNTYYQGWSVQACKSSTNCSDFAYGNGVTARDCRPNKPLAKTPILRECTGNNTQKVTFGWYPVTGSTKYQVTRTGFTSPKDVIKNAQGILPISYVDNNIASNTSYTYQVRACIGIVCGNYSDAATVTAKACSAPTPLSCPQQCSQANRFCGSIGDCKCTSSTTDNNGTCLGGKTCRRINDGETVGYYCGTVSTPTSPTPSASGCSASDKKDPGLELRYTSDRIQTANKGTEVKYRLQLKNRNNTGCGETEFTLTANAPSGWSKSITGGDISNNKITIGANDNSWHNFVLAVTSPNSATAGNYDASISVTGDPGHSASMNDLKYVVKSGGGNNTPTPTPRVNTPTPTPRANTPTPRPITPTPTPGCTTSANCSNNNTCVNGTCQSQYACSGNQCVKTVGGQYDGSNCGGNCTPGPTENPTPTKSPTCRPRPACLDKIPRCAIPETLDMCPPPGPECTTSANCSNNNTCVNGTCQSQYACSGNQCVKTVGGQYDGSNCGGNCTPGPTENPTPTPTPPPYQSRLIVFTIGLHNIGSTGDSLTPDPALAGSNSNPQTTTRNLEILFLDSQEQPIGTFDTTVLFSNNTANPPEVGKFVGILDFDGTLASGNYIIKTRSSGYLWKRVPGGIRAIDVTTQNVAPLTELVSGDINMDNQINLSDFQIYRSCSIYSHNESLCNGNSFFRTRSDINNDGVIDSIDQTMLQKEMSVRQGD